MNEQSESDQQPLADLDEWEEDVIRRYPNSSQTESPGSSEFTDPGSSEFTDPGKSVKDFRNYDADVRPGVRKFYRLNHRFQTYDFVRKKREKFLKFEQRRMSIWEAMEFLNTLVDDSDPDTDLTQIEHLMQTAESIRADGHPRWFILTGLIHDLGKVLCLFGEPQWAVVGDTFPVGCAFSDRIVFPEFFDENPDRSDTQFNTELGVYQRHGGLDQVLMSWGHDEYLYHVVKECLPTEALYMIRYHSFYAGHRERQYEYLMNDQDRKMFEWVRVFNPYDLYTKSHDRPDVGALRTFYQDLIDEFFPGDLRW